MSEPCGQISLGSLSMRVVSSEIGHVDDHGDTWANVHRDVERATSLKSLNEEDDLRLAVYRDQGPR